MKRISATCNSVVCPFELVASDGRSSSGCHFNLWGRTGFDLDSYARLQAEDDGWPLKIPIENTHANDNIDMEMAPSVAEADEILASFGYVEEEALQLAA